MSKAYENHHVFRFGDFVLDVDRGALLCNGAEIKLRPKSFDVLNYLVEHHGRLVARDELLEAVWHGSVVTDDAVTQCLIDIRRALGDTSQEFIRTVTRRGYIFELPVTEVHDADANLPAVSPRQGVIVVVATALLLAFGLAVVALWPAAPGDSAADSERAIVGPASSELAIAVLPFAVMSDDRAQTYFADGVSEEILNLLARQSGMKVIARTSSFSYRDRDVDIATIASQLGVSHILEGSLRRDGEEIRIDVKLVDAATGAYLWIEQFDRALSADNLFAIQSEIAESVSEALKSELTLRDRAQLAVMPSRNLDALDAYFDGRARLETRDPEQLRAATRLFERAIELDPEFALAYVALSDVFRLRNNYGSMSNIEADARSEAAVRSALEINDQLGEAYASLANVLQRRGDFDGAERAFLRGIELSPNYAPLYQWYAEKLGDLGRIDEAMRYAKISVALDPRSAIIRRDYALRLTEAGRFDEAGQQFDLAIGIDPDLALGYIGKARLRYQFQGEIADAISLLRHAYSINDSSPNFANILSQALIDLAFFDEANDLIIRTMANAPEHPWSREVYAHLLILRGEEAEAIENARFLLDHVPGAPLSVSILRDYYLRRGEAEKALELYRQYESSLFEETSQSFDLRGWTFPNAIDLSLVLKETGRIEFANALLDACLEKALRNERDGIGPPIPYAARVYAILDETEYALAALRRAVDRGWRAGWQYAYEHDLAFEDLREAEEFHEIFAELRADIERQRRSLESSSGLPVDSAH